MVLGFGGIDINSIDGGHFRSVDGQHGRYSFEFDCSYHVDSARFDYCEPFSTKFVWGDILYEFVDFIHSYPSAGLHDCCIFHRDHSEA